MCSPRLIAEQPPDRFGLEPGLRPRPPGIKRHPVEGEAGQGRFPHSFLDRAAGLEGRRKPVPDEVPQLVLGGRHPHRGAGVLGDRPARAVHHRLGLRALGRALHRDVADGIVGKVLHHRPHPGRGVRAPPAGQGRGFVDLDVFFAPLRRGAPVGWFAGRAETFDERAAKRSHTPGRTFPLDGPLRPSPVLGLPRGGSRAQAGTKKPLGVDRGAVAWGFRRPTSPPSVRPRARRTLPSSSSERLVDDDRNG